VLFHCTLSISNSVQQENKSGKRVLSALSVQILQKTDNVANAEQQFRIQIFQSSSHTSHKSNFQSVIEVNMDMEIEVEEIEECERMEVEEEQGEVEEEEVTVVEVVVKTEVKKSKV